MTINEVIEYIMNSPQNTNRAILIQMLRELIIDNDGNLDNSWGGTSTLGEGVLGETVLGG